MKSVGIALLAMALALGGCGQQPRPAASGIHGTTILKAERTWDGAPIAYPAGKPEITGMIIDIAPGSETGWHSHPVPSFGMVLEGELDVHLKNGAVKHLKAGDALAEVVNTLHNGCNAGSGPVRIVVFYAGTSGVGLTDKP